MQKLIALPYAISCHALYLHFHRLFNDYTTIADFFYCFCLVISTDSAIHDYSRGLILLTGFSQETYLTTDELHCHGGDNIYTNKINHFNTNVLCKPNRPHLWGARKHSTYSDVDHKYIYSLH